jgi:hypothetical protein
MSDFMNSVIVSDTGTGELPGVGLIISLFLYVYLACLTVRRAWHHHCERCTILSRDLVRRHLSHMYPVLLVRLGEMRCPLPEPPTQPDAVRAHCRNRRNSNQPTTNILSPCRQSSLDSPVPSPVSALSVNVRLPLSFTAYENASLARRPVNRRLCASTLWFTALPEAPETVSESMGGFGRLGPQDVTLSR